MNKFLKKLKRRLLLVPMHLALVAMTFGCSDIRLSKVNRQLSSSAQFDTVAVLPPPKVKIGRMRVLFFVDQSFSMVKGKCPEDLDGANPDPNGPKSTCVAEQGIDPEAHRYDVLSKWVDELKALAGDDPESDVKVAIIPFSGGIKARPTFDERQDPNNKYRFTPLADAPDWIAKLRQEHVDDLTAVQSNSAASGKYLGTTVPYSGLTTASSIIVNEMWSLRAQKIVETSIKMPQGYYLQWGGNFKNLQEARARLLILTPISLLVVLLMIFAAFGSVGQTVLIFLCIPFALVGGVISLILNELPFSISAGVGFIALSGIAVLNGVVLVNYFNQLKAEGKSGKDLVVSGTLIRLRPVLMTALVAIFGFVPMMLSTGVGAEVQRPLASVVIGGIISSTILTLIVLPTLFSIFEDKFKGRVAH
jgi:hypothetical protein